MGTLITLAVAVAILGLAARFAWPRRVRAPLPLYAGTIVVAFVIGIIAGSLAEGRGIRRTLEFAGMLAPLIGAVAVVSWFRVKPPEQDEARKLEESRAERRRADERRRR